MSQFSKTDKEGFEEAFKHMLNHIDYKHHYVFYAHMITKCIVQYKDIPAPAGVMFNVTKYNLLINPEQFNILPLEHRIGILKHEMLHILYKHVQRREERDHKLFNYSSDCAINQLINRTHLPDYGIFPDTMQEKLNIKVPLNKDSEFYYELFNEHADELLDEDEGDGEGGELIDDHSTWEESQGGEDMQREVTKKMIDNAMQKTIKSKGNLPSDISDIIELHTYTPKVSWKRETRRILGNRKTNVRSTIKRRPRRFPDRYDLNGKTKDRTFDVCVVLDVSGSMSTDEIMQGLNELHKLCELTNSDLTLIQVDTQIHAIEKFTKKTKIFTRTGSGGTVMEPAMTYIKENRIPSDLVVLITDGYIEDISNWKYPPKRLIALLTDDTTIPGIEYYGNAYKQFNIKDV